jgi:hypothetical protein
LDTIQQNDNLLITTKDNLIKIQQQLDKLQLKQYFPPQKILKTDFDIL